MPDTLQELLTTQIIASQTFLDTQLLFHLDLGGDAGMVNTGNPQCIVALHTLEADQGVLQGGVHCVTHVQLASNIGRGHNDGERLLALITLCVEVAAFLPHVIDPRLNLLRLIDLG